MRPAHSLLLAALALTPLAALAEDYDVSCYPIADCDADGDGYADSGIAGCSRETVLGVAFEDKLQCPSGYVKLSGDCDDGDSAVHPRLREEDNGVDDNCDGRIDEPEFYYSPWGTAVTTTGFEIPVRVVDPTIYKPFDVLGVELE